MQFFMAKYSYQFKLEVVQYYLANNAGRRFTARYFSISDSLVRTWVTLYQHQGNEGLANKSNRANYDEQFKLQVVKSVILEGLSEREAFVRFNLRHSGQVNKWLCQYKEGGIDSLRPKSLGRKPMINKKPRKNKKTDQFKTPEELLEELIYLRAENAYLKKLDALIREEEELLPKQELSRD